VSKEKNILFLGIGGAGMTPLAQYYLSQGWKVLGYDRVLSPNVAMLQAKGVEVVVDDQLRWFPLFEEASQVVYTAAIATDHKVLQSFRDRSCSVLKRAEVLGHISKSHKTIGVAGTHGKTTTSAILTNILNEGDGVLSFVGGNLRNFESNFIFSGDEFMVAEADEFDRSLLHLDPYFSVLTNLEADHLDIYKDEKDLEETLLKFQRSAKHALVHESLPADFASSALVYGEGDSADYQLSEYVVKERHVALTFKKRGEQWLSCEWAVPGKYNALNALASAAVASEIGLSDDVIARGISGFKGVKRRFEIQHWGKKVLIDDYAHHPGEITAFLKGVHGMFPGKKVLGIFQPHLYSRTRDFLGGFADSLSALSEVWVLPIYEARELPIPGVSSEVLVEKIGQRARLVEKRHLKDEFIRSINEFDVFLTIGAGDISAFLEILNQALNEFE